MAKVVIFGTGDVARLAEVYFTRDTSHEVVAFTVDAAYRKSDSFHDLPLVDFEQVVRSFPPSQYQMFVAVGYGRINRARADKYRQAKALGYHLVSYLSSRCTYLTDHPIGDNCFILEDNTIQPFVRIGNNVTLWSGNHIGHDAVIEDHCFLTSHVVVSGHTRIREYSFLGVNATLRNSITIGRSNVIGAGAIIMKDTIDEGVYLPERAKLFDKRSNEIEI